MVRPGVATLHLPSQSGLPRHMAGVVVLPKLQLKMLDRDKTTLRPVAASLVHMARGQIYAPKDGVTAVLSLRSPL